MWNVATQDWLNAPHHPHDVSWSRWSTSSPRRWSPSSTSVTDPTSGWSTSTRIINHKTWINQLLVSFSTDFPILYRFSFTIQIFLNSAFFSTRRPCKVHILFSFIRITRKLPRKFFILITRFPYEQQNSNIIVINFPGVCSSFIKCENDLNSEWGMGIWSFHETLEPSINWQPYYEQLNHPELRKRKV